MTFLYSKWLALPIQTRHALAHAFNIKKKNPTHVIDDVVKDDGYVIGDIETALSADAIAAYLGFNSNIDAWDALIAKVEGRVLPVDDSPAVIDPAFIKAEVAPKKKTVAKKK